MDEFDARLAGLREHVDDEIRRLDMLALERLQRLEERFQAQQIAISKAERALAETLTGFPETYGRKLEVDRLRDDIASIRQDHVQRREFEELREFMLALREAEANRSSRYLERELFDTTVSQWMTWRSGVDQTLAQMVGRGLGITNLSELLLRTIPIIVAVISTVAAIYFASR